MVQKVARLFGVVFLLVGVLGFFGFAGGGMTMSADLATAPKLLGLFPVNTFHNCVHILFGIWGLAAAGTAAGALTYCRLGGGIYLVLAVLGLITPTTFGLIPIGGNDIWLHAILGIALLLAAMQGAKAPAATAS
jgi:hypothetical protein